ncbi:MAG: hypothetical protein ACLP9K_09575 [Nitrososphaerales archaeon]
MAAMEVEELFLWTDAESVRQMRGNEKAFGRIKEKVADVSIYLLNLSDVPNIGLSEAVTEKLIQKARTTQ